MLLKLILTLCFFIHESFSFLKLEQKTNNQSKINKHHHAMITTRCGLQCLLKCSIGNHQPTYGCLENCLFNCQWEKPMQKYNAEVASKIDEDIGSVDLLSHFTKVKCDSWT